MPIRNSCAAFAGPWHSYDKSSAKLHFAIPFVMNRRNDNRMTNNDIANAITESKIEAPTIHACTRRQTDTHSIFAITDSRLTR